MPALNRTFAATLLSLGDGDTFHVLIDTIVAYAHFKVRLARVNAPEASAPGGPAATAFLAAWLPPPSLLIPAAQAWPLRVQVLRPDNYGDRWDCEVWRATDGANLSDSLLASGNAVPYRARARGDADPPLPPPAGGSEGVGV